MRKFLFRLCLLMRNELKQMGSRPLYLFSIFAAPLLCVLFFTSLMGEGLPTDMPVGIVDEDNTATSRNIVRTMDAFQYTKIVARYGSVAEARDAMQRGKLYAFYYIPKGTTQEAVAGRQPTVSFYTNNAYLIAGSLLYKDLRTMSELANGAVGRSTLYAKGATASQAMAFLQPIVIETHPINNPWLNYSVYLCNTILPGIFMIFIFLTTIFSIGTELKNNTARRWMRMADNRVWLALTGKLLPQTILFFVLFAFYDVYMFRFLQFPCHCGIGVMLFTSLLTVAASQGLAVFLFGLFPSMRLALSTASLWGVVSFSISGFSFPVMGMPAALQALSVLFPLRHYYLIYVNEALNGYAMSYVWQSYLALLLFALLPLLVLRRLRTAFLHYKYLP